MIFLIIGPPAAGKSTFCKFLTEEFFHLQWRDIKECRALTETEKDAWALLEAATERHGLEIPPFVLLESSGLSPEILEIKEKHPCWIIKITGAPDDLLGRLIDRQKAESLSALTTEDEQAFLSWALPHIDKQDADLFIDTTEESMEEAKEKLVKFVIDKSWLREIQ